jgi:type II secretory pathway pseudopilin PulG
MGRDARLRSEASFPGGNAGQWLGQRPGHRRGQGPSQRGIAGFIFLELVLVLFVLGLLAGLLAPRYYSDYEEQARLGAARSALAEGYSRLTLATARYAVAHGGHPPQALADLSPAYMNATEALGDFTAAYAQGSGEITVAVYSGADASGTPLLSRAIPWP